jgi:hypothetical protein
MATRVEARGVAVAILDPAQAVSLTRSSNWEIIGVLNLVIAGKAANIVSATIS